MGDFWGIEHSHPEFDDHKGCSCALVRSKKASERLKQLPGTEILSVTVAEVTKKQSNAFAPSTPNPRRAEFWKDYTSGGLAAVLPKYYCYTLKNRLKSFIKFILFKLHLHNYV